MANEISIRSSLQINKGQLEYVSRPTQYNANMVGSKGPSPGAITATIAGTDVDFSELTTPGACRIQNLDTVNFVEYGIWDPEGATFYPLGELLPGESYVIRLSRFLQKEFGEGSGTTGPDTNRLRVKADTASVDVLVEAFEA